MRLLHKQFLFMRLLPKLIEKAHEFGFEVTEGDAFRDHRLHGDMGVKKGYGRANSAHKMRLAFDLNLFKDDDYLITTEDHKPIGEWWKQQHELCRWGGDFHDESGNPIPDGNHYSLEHNGVC